MVALAKGGVQATFDICYLANSFLFPAIFAGTAFGICNAVAMFSAIFSPIAAEMNGSLPMLIYCFTSLGAILAVLFLNLSQKKT